MAKRREAEIEVTPSSGNVFADLGFDQPDEELAKAKLAVHIWKIINDRKMTQAAAGIRLSDIRYSDATLATPRQLGCAAQPPFLQTKDVLF